MAIYYEFDTPTGTVSVKDGKAAVTLTVKNTSSKALRTRFDVEPDGPAQKTWIKVRKKAGVTRW